MTVPDWIHTLNDLFYVFPSEAAAESFGNAQVRAFARSSVSKIVLRTERLPETTQDKLVVSRINGGAINGLARRGPSTYRSWRGWTGGDPAELGFRAGLSSEELRLAAETPWVVAALDPRPENSTNPLPASKVS